MSAILLKKSLQKLEIKIMFYDALELHKCDVLSQLTLACSRLEGERTPSFAPSRLPAFLFFPDWQEPETGLTNPGGSKKQLIWSSMHGNHLITTDPGIAVI